MRYNLEFIKKTSEQLLPFIDLDPALVAPHLFIDITTDEHVAGPFSNPVPVIATFRVVEVKLSGKGNHNGVVLTGEPTLVLTEV